LEPPGTRAGSIGFIVRPNAECSVDDPIANSSRLVLHATRPPAARIRSMTVASNGDWYPSSIRDAQVVGRTVVTMLSLTPIALPASAPPELATLADSASSASRDHANTA